MKKTDRPHRRRRKAGEPVVHGSAAEPRRTGPMGAIEGADRGALGTADPPQPAPPGAAVDPSEHLVPGADFDDRKPTQAKPWFTSLAADSHQAGVANEPDDESS